MLQRVGILSQEFQAHLLNRPGIVCEFDTKKDLREVGTGSEKP